MRACVLPYPNVPFAPVTTASGRAADPDAEAIFFSCFCDVFLSVFESVTWRRGQFAVYICIYVSWLLEISSTCIMSHHVYKHHVKLSTG